MTPEPPLTKIAEIAAADGVLLAPEKRSMTKPLNSVGRTTLSPNTTPCCEALNCSVVVGGWVLAQ